MPGHVKSAAIMAIDRVASNLDRGKESAVAWVRDVKGVDKIRMNPSGAYDAGYRDGYLRALAKLREDLK